MSAISTLNHDSALQTLLVKLVYTKTYMEANPLAAPLAVDYEALLTTWFQVNQQEILLYIDILKATALIATCDKALDVLVDEVSRVLLNLTDGDNTQPLYVLYFKKTIPSRLKKPILGGQLGAMREWIPLLKDSPHASLKTLAPRVEAAVDAADKAVKKLNAAKQANHEFRAVGARRQFVDQLNSTRKSSFGKLAEMPHKHPDANLPLDFAEQFFKRDSRPKKDDEPLSSEDLAALIAERESELAALKDELQETLAREAEEAQRLEDEAARLEEAQKARAEAEKLLAKAAALEAGISKK